MKKNFKLEFSSFMTKKEREILKLILENYLFNKGNNFNLISLDVPKLKNDELNFFERFAKKGVWLIENNEKLYLNYFSAISICEEKVNFQLNEAFLKFICDKELINSYSLYDFLFLKHSISLDFFFKFMLTNIRESSFEVPLLELKHALKVENYSRMYDLDRFVLQLITTDISDNTQFNLNYEKIKILGKVEKIRFNIRSKKSIETETNIKMLLFLFKKYIKDNKKFIQLLEKQLKVHEYSKLKKMIVNAIELLPKFEYNFEKSLNFILEKGYSYDYILIKKNSYKFENNHNIFKFLFKDIQLYLSEDDEIFTHSFSDKFTNKIYHLKENSPIVVKTEKSKLEIKYIEDILYMDIYSKKEIFKK